mmetsp:Transcript_36409/g.74248  ORF Transcript_36409/g.74248 Transcript_36409/m.74248 type:complete len:254 (-) Transcript_36409:629-1390(-)
MDVMPSTIELRAGGMMGGDGEPSSGVSTSLTSTSAASPLTITTSSSASEATASSTSSLLSTAATLSNCASASLIISNTFSASLRRASSSRMSAAWAMGESSVTPLTNKTPTSVGRDSTSVSDSIAVTDSVGRDNVRTFPVPSSLSSLPPLGLPAPLPILIIPTLSSLDSSTVIAPLSSSSSSCSLAIALTATSTPEEELALAIILALFSARDNSITDSSFCSSLHLSYSPSLTRLGGSSKSNSATSSTSPSSI